jgi:hypothetical protein
MKVRAAGGGCWIEMAVLASHALFAAALVVPAAARADACRIETSGVESPEWSAATASLVELALTDRDCVRVQLELSGDRARVLFTTPDGRTAQRFVATPSELRPTIDALRVQGPAAPEPAAPPQARTPEQPAPSVEPAAAARDSDLRLALLAGLRGDPGSLVSPALTGELSIGAGILELGASLSAEIQYFDVTGTGNPERQGSAAVLAAQAGVRVPSGSFDWRVGARIAFAPLLTVNHDTQACPVGTVCPFPREDERTSEWRFGAYAGLSVPNDSVVRFRTELGLDVVTPDPGDSSLALTPAGAISALLGLEVAP